IPPAGGTPTTTVFDARGRTTQLCQHQTAPSSGSCAGADVTSYQYTPAGLMSEITDAAGNQWANTYDLLGGKASANDPDTWTTTSTYDDLGRLTSSTDARSRTISTTYDALGRRTAEYDTSGGAAQNASDQLAAWAYDAVAKGELASSISYANGSAYTNAVTGY